MYTHTHADIHTPTYTNTHTPLSSDKLLFAWTLSDNSLDASTNAYLTLDEGGVGGDLALSRVWSLRLPGCKLVQKQLEAYAAGPDQPCAHNRGRSHLAT